MQITNKGDIFSGSLVLSRDWIRSHYPFALDVFKSFLGSFNPIPENEYYQNLVAKIWEFNNPQRIKDLANNEVENKNDLERIMLTFFGKTEKENITNDFSSITVENIDYKGAFFFKLDILLWI